MALKTRKPTGAVPWPLILIEGEAKAGKTWACAQFSASPRISRCFWIDLGEGAADEYGAIPGADYEIVEHDGSFTALLDNVKEIRKIGEKALAAGEKPIALVIDTMTEEWAILSEWATNRARSSKYNKKKLADDPNAEIKVSTNYWNDANARHKELMTLLKRFPGIVLMTSHGKQVAVMDDSGQPAEGKKEHKVEAQKTLAGDATIWLRLFQSERGIIVGGRSVHLQFKPGEDEPVPLAKNWSLESVIFDVFQCDPAVAHVRNIADRKQDAVDPDAMRDEALKPETSVARLKELYTECVRAGLGGVTVTNERQAEELLRLLIARVGTERAARAALDFDPYAELDDADPWLLAARDALTTADVERIRGELLETFKGKEGEMRVRALLAVLDLRAAEVAPKAVAA
jgi:hypothetical protein